MMNQRQLALLQRMEFVDMLDRLSLRLNQVFDVMAPEPQYSIARLRVLRYILANGPSKMTDLTRALGVKKATMTGLADLLVRDGQVVREYSRSDRRVVLLAIPQRTEKIMKRKLYMYFISAVNSMKCESYDQQKQFAELGHALIAMIEARLGDDFITPKLEPLADVLSYAHTMREPDYVA